MWDLPRAISRYHGTLYQLKYTAEWTTLLSYSQSTQTIWLSALLPYNSHESSQVELSITPHNVPTDAGGVEWIQSEGSIAQKKLHPVKSANDKNK
jgi:hypothetical protein